MIKVKPLTGTFIIFAMLLLTQAVYAGIDFSYRCHDENCKEGTLIDYHVLLINTANATLTFDRLILINRQFRIIVDFDVTRPITLNPGESRFYNFTREVKALPDNSYTLTVQPCFEVKRRQNENLSFVYEFCDPIERHIPILPIAKINCNTTADCDQDEECVFYKCKKMECGQGEVARSHKCVAADCGMFTELREGECRLKTSYVAGAIAGLVVIAAIVFAWRTKSIEYVTKPESSHVKTRTKATKKRR